MNCDNFSVQSTLEATYLNVKLAEPVRLDEISMKVINSDCPDFLLPYRLTTVNDTVTLKYKLVNTVALAYANMTLSKERFVRFYMNLLIPFVKGSDWFLDYHNLCVDPRYVYLDNHSGKIYYIYVPEYNTKSTDAEILSFFKNVFTNSQITDDKDFQVRLFRYFTSADVTLMGLYQIFQEEAASPAPLNPNTVSKYTDNDSHSSGANSGRSADYNNGTAYGRDADEEKAEKKDIGNSDSGKGGFFGGFGKKKTEEPKKEDIGKKKDDFFNDDSQEILSGLGGFDDYSFFGDSKKNKKKEAKEKPIKEKPVKEKEKKGGFFGTKKKETESSERENASRQKVQKGRGTSNWDNVNMFQPDDLSDETDISEGGNTYGGAVLELVDSELPGAMRRIPLEFIGNYVTIGRLSSDQMKPDIAFPAEFKRIGRQHARIEKMNGGLYLIDLGSANHTFINGDIMAPNQPYRLTNGMEITFSNTKSVIYRVRM